MYLNEAPATIPIAVSFGKSPDTTMDTSTPTSTKRPSHPGLLFLNWTLVALVCLLAYFIASAAREPRMKAVKVAPSLLIEGNGPRKALKTVTVIANDYAELIAGHPTSGPSNGGLTGHPDIDVLVSAKSDTRSKYDALNNLETQYHSDLTNEQHLREEMVHDQGCSLLHFLASASRIWKLSTVAEPFYLLEAVLQAGVSPDGVLSTWSWEHVELLGLTPLSLVCLTNSTDSARVLIKAGANTTHEISKSYKSIATFVVDQTPDDFATACLDILLRHGTAVDVDTIRLASALGKQKYLEKLLEYHDITDFPPGATTYKLDLIQALQDESLPLIWAAMATSPDVQKVGSYVTACDSSTFELKVTPLMLATHWCCTVSVEMLLAAGAKVHEASSRGNTALHKAFAVGCFPVAKLLVQHGASMRAENMWGNVPLYLAMYTGKWHLVAWALDEGHYGVNEKKSDGMTPLKFAEDIRSRHAVKMLQERGSLLPRTTIDPQRRCGTCG